jgi:hypothetical protein
LGAVLFEKATPQLVGRLICREYYKPKELENDPPSEDQQPSSDDEYGPDGDFPKLNLPGFGPGWAGGTWLASAALEAAANFVPGVAVVFILVTLFGVAVAVSTILPPTFPGPPIPPHDPEDPYAKYIYDAINKDFERWRFHEDYPDARKTALDCALDYRDAIALLRKALNSPLVVKHIGKMLYKDYRLRLAYLLHGFSNLSREFGEKWLDMSKINVALSFIEGDTKLQVMWDPLYLDEDTAYAVSITVNGHEIEKDAACLDTTYIIDGSAFAGSGSRIVASVTAVTAVQGGDPPYAFFSQGAVAKGTYNQPFISVHHLDLAYAPKFPDGLEAVCHENGQAVRDSKSYPVLKIGSSTFWRACLSFLSSLCMLMVRSRSSRLCGWSQLVSYCRI